MNTNSRTNGAPTFLSAGSFTCARPTGMSALLLTAAILGAGVLSGRGVTFTNNACLMVTNDPAKSLTSTSGVFTVACWFRLTVPSSLPVTEDMTLFMDRADGDESANYSFLLRVNTTSGALEFLSKGTSSSASKQLLDSLFVGRWYHLAVTKTSGGVLTGYIDGKQVFQAGVTLGDTTGSGFAIGGFNGTSKLFYGDIIEVSLYDVDLQYQDIRDMMFSDQRLSPFPDSLRAYYKLGYSTNAADNLANFVTPTPVGTSPIAKVGSGNVAFDPVDQTGEQSLFDSHVNGGQNAIAPLSGLFSWQQAALSRPVPGIAFDFRYVYSGALPGPPSSGDDAFHRRTLSLGWRHSFDTRVTSEILPNGGKEIRIMSWDGAIESWVQTNIAFPFQTRHGEYRGELRELADYRVEWTTPQRLVYLFNAPGSASLAGRLREVRDANGNKLTLQWNANAFLTNVVDSSGASYRFNYFGNYLTNVSFGEWQVYFAYDTSNRLWKQWHTNTSGLYTNVNTTWQFYYNYAGHVNTYGLLDRVVDARGYTNVMVSYDKYRRKTQTADALNRTVKFEYAVPDYRSIRMSDPENKQRLTTFDRKGRVVSETDPLTNVTAYTYDVAGNRTSITEPLGWKTLFAYDNRANMIARTNALGQVTRWTYHTNFNRPTAEINAEGRTTYFTLDDNTGNILAQYDALGLIVTNLYDSRGLLLSSTDGRGLTSCFTNDANGFLIAKRDAAGYTTRYTYNDLGWKLSEADALGQTTIYNHDLNGNVVRILDPLGRVFTKTYDANGNLLSTSDAKGQLTSYAYDAANQKTNMVDRTATNRWSYTYTPRGSLAATTDPLTNTVSNTYDAANRLIQVSGPLGNTIKNYYDANGNLTNMVDQLTNRWIKTYDELNRVVAETDPQGDTKFTEYDLLGRVKKTTSPKGYSSVNEYDSRGRLIRWVDPENNEWYYDYDPNGNITNITDALQGHYAMAYGPRNERTLERNQDEDGKEWHYDYDELGRLKQQTDPNGTTRTLEYDDGGRVVSVRFSTGRVNALYYDDNNNPEMVTRSDPGQPATLTLLEYDLMDRVTLCRDSFNKSIRYAYDALGRRAKLTYPDGKSLTYAYDALSRLTSQADWAGRQMTYQYDAASRLRRRSYPNGVVQTNAFDESGQLTNLTYSVTNAVPTTNAINIALTYAYDKNGNKAASTETGTLDWPRPALRDEMARYWPSGRLIDRQITLTSSTNPQLSTLSYHYDSSGNMTKAVGNGQSWTLAYDEDNRTTRISWDCGMTHKDITNRYDASGRRIAKSADGIQTGYVLDLAPGMERILCDLAPNGHITAYYVHGPDLCYKVDATNGLTCYHGDAQANIVALSAAAANTVA